METHRRETVCRMPSPDADASALARAHGFSTVASTVLPASDIVMYVYIVLAWKAALNKI